MKVYVVHMQRWGDPEAHSYIIGTYSDKAVALEQGLREKEWRANKYEPNIVEIILDKQAVCRCKQCHELYKAYDTCDCRR